VTWGRHERPPRRRPQSGVVASSQGQRSTMTHSAHDVKLTTGKGDAALDPRVEGIAVYATSATTTRLQAAKRVTTAATP
jgi:hypothetical protein